jgi:hypothetical protein
MSKNLILQFNKYFWKLHYHKIINYDGKIRGKWVLQVAGYLFLVIAFRGRSLKMLQPV